MTTVMPKTKVQIDGWMACDFTSFPTVFQLYQDIGLKIMKSFMQWNPDLE